MSVDRAIVSIIIVTYNTKYYMLKEAIESILKQTYQSFEIILIDDHSDKYSDFSFLDEYHDNRIRFYQCNENKGLAHCTNWGIELSKGKYIARLDADDIALPKRLEEQVKYMEKHKDAPVLVSRGISFGDRSFVVGAIPSNSEYIRTGFLLNCGIIHSTAIFRKSYLVDNGILYDSSFRKAQDYELWTRISERGDRIHMLNKCLCLYRIHHGQASNYQVSNEQKNNAAKIKRKVLCNLYNPSEKDFKCQESLGFKKLLDGLSVSDVHIWMKKLLSINKKTKRYKQRYLKLLLVYKYLGMIRSDCSINNLGYVIINYPLETVWAATILLYKKILKLLYIRYIPAIYF